MKTGPYTLCHTDKGSIQWWAWPAAAFGIGFCLAATAIPGQAGPVEIVLGGFVLATAVIPGAVFAFLAVDFWRYRRCR
jgi:hypothetical protein